MTLDPRLFENAPELLARINAEKARRSFKEFVHQAWDIVEPGTPLIWGWVMDALCEHLQAVAEGKIRRLVICVPPGTSKALVHDTPILTLDGWKTHGTLEVGDYVFGMDGLPKRVEAVSPDMVDECFDVEFDDGAVIRASKNHEWLVERDVSDNGKKWNRYRRQEVVETKDLIATEDVKDSDARQDRIALPAPLYGVKRHLLIEPYLLGAWLGDGSSASAHLYVSEQDLAGLAHYGPARPMGRTNVSTQDFFRIYVEGMMLPLNALNLKNNKHIPSEYLLGSRDQRLALLQGLMDTDGHCTEKGIAGFSNKNLNLAEGVMYLARSLGCKPTLKTRPSKLNGVEHGDYHQVFFRPPEGFKPFRLERKNARIQPHSGSNSIRTRYRYVKSVTSVGPQACRCIQVEGGVYLAGEALVPTHNSRLTRVFFPTWVWTRNQHHAFISASYALDLTIRDNLATRRVVESEWYQSTFGISVADDDGGKTGFSLNTGGSLKALTVGTGKTTGFRGDTFLIDDPLNVMDANSPAKRADANEWFKSAAQNRLNNVSKSSIVLIMQRVAEDDVAATALAMGYDSLIIPMVWEESYRKTTSIGWTDPRTEEGELMFPERFPQEYVDTLPDAELGMGPYAFAAQYQQTPVPRKGALFLVDNIKTEETLPEDEYLSVRAWDLAGTEGAGAYTVGVRMRYGKNSGRFFIDDVRRGQWSSGRVREEILKTAEDDGTETRIMLPKDPGQAGVAQIDDLTALLAGFSVKAEPQSGSKEVRAEPLASQVERGRVSVIKDTWTNPLIDEMRFFPKGKFADQCDAAASAFNALAALTRQRRRHLSLVVDSEGQDNWAKQA